MRKFFRYAVYVLAVIVVVIVGLLAYVTLALPNVGAAPDMTVEITPEKVERGEYLAWHVMMCVDCHAVRDFSQFSGPPVPGTELSGGEVFDQSMGFPGRFISANITPAGISDWTDGELFRLITTGVKRDGEPIFPVMPYHNFGRLDTEDIEAVIAYLRTLEPIETDHPQSEVDFPFSLILRTIPQRASLDERPPATDRIAYGEYMFTAAACGECHTQFERGNFVGPLGGGGREFVFPDGSIVRSANLTPHQTGIAYLEREDFIQRFKMYGDTTYALPSVRPGEFQTLMPWYMYSGMTEEDLGAIHDFLRSLMPYDNPVELFTPAASR